jgi:hypothetical protein
MPTSRQRIVAGCLFGCLVIIGLATWLRPTDPACVKLEAKRNLSLEFCKNLAVKAAHEKCQDLADDPQTLGACMNVVVPVAESSCWGYLNVKAMAREIESLCN